jgi:hypothetical protein
MLIYILWAVLAMAEEGLLIQEMIEKEQEGVVVVVGRVALERIKLMLLVGSCKHYYTL